MTDRDDKFMQRNRDKERGWGQGEGVDDATPVVTFPVEGLAEGVKGKDRQVDRKKNRQEK